MAERDERVRRESPYGLYELRKLPEDERWKTVPLSESETWRLENAKLLTMAYQVAVIGSSVVLSILLFVVPYRLWRPKNGAARTDSNVRSVAKEQSTSRILDWIDARKGWQFVLILYLARWAVLAPVVLTLTYGSFDGWPAGDLGPDMSGQNPALVAILLLVVGPFAETLLECALPYWFMARFRHGRGGMSARPWGFVLVSALLMALFHPVLGAILPSLITGAFLAYCYAHFAYKSTERAILATTMFHGAINVVGVVLLLAIMVSQNPGIAKALEEYRVTVVAHDLRVDSVFPNYPWTTRDDSRLEQYPTEDDWPKVLGWVDTDPRLFRVVPRRPSNTREVVEGPVAYTLPLDWHLMPSEGYRTLLFLEGMTPNARAVARSSVSIVCLGKMEGELFIKAYATVLIKGDVSGQIESDSYLNLVVTGNFSGRIDSRCYAMIYLLGGFDGAVKLEDSKVYIAGRTTEAELERIEGRGRVYLEESDLPPGEHKIRDLEVTVAGAE